jgi:hypothetical protein
MDKGKALTRLIDKADIDTQRDLRAIVAILPQTR